MIKLSKLWLLLADRFTVRHLSGVHVALRISRSDGLIGQLTSSLFLLAFGQKIRKKNYNLF